MADRVLPSRYMQVERNDDHPLAWFTPDGKGWVPVDGADPSAIDYEAGLAVARELWTVEPVWDESSFALMLNAALREV